MITALLSAANSVEGGPEGNHNRSFTDGEQIQISLARRHRSFIERMQFGFAACR